MLTITVARLLHTMKSKVQPSATHQIRFDPIKKSAEPLTSTNSYSVSKIDVGDEDVINDEEDDESIASVR